MANSNDFRLDKKSVVSSAIRLILYSIPLIVIPLISGLFLMLMAIISATNIKSSAEIGHPCLIERESDFFFKSIHYCLHTI